MSSPSPASVAAMAMGPSQDGTSASGAGRSWAGAAVAEASQKRPQDAASDRSTDCTSERSAPTRRSLSPSGGKGKGSGKSTGHSATRRGPQGSSWPGYAIGARGLQRPRTAMPKDVTLVVLDEDAPPGFSLRGCVLGEGGQNLRQITEQTGVRISLVGR